MKHTYFFAFVLSISVAHADTLQRDRVLPLPQTRREAQDLMDNAAKDFAAAQVSHNRIMQNAENLVSLTQEANQKSLSQFAQLQRMIQSGASGASLLAATKSMQEMQMNFNLQYLQLQSQMRHENRSYMAVSRIMKTKHDTVKNSISNIR